MICTAPSNDQRTAVIAASTFPIAFIEGTAEQSAGEEHLRRDPRRQQVGGRCDEFTSAEISRDSASPANAVSARVMTNGT